MSAETIYPSIDGQAVFITGGATGIGATMVEAFSRQGARVGFIDVNGDAAHRFAETLAQKTNVRPWFEVTDVTDVAAMQATIQRASDSLGPIRALVNNVGNDQRLTPSELTLERWQQCMAVNLDAAFFASQSVYDGMRKAGGGSIVNISSINAELAPKKMSGYVTAKAGLIGMTKALARDFGDAAIRVNAVLPGWVVTERQLDSWLTPEAEAKWMEQVALKARLMPNDVANLVLFLIADDSAMITGQKFIIDGGRL